MGKHDDKILPDGSVDYRARRKKKSGKRPPESHRASYNRRPDENDEQFGAFRRLRDMHMKDREWGIFFELYPHYRDYPIAEWYEQFEWKDRIEHWDSSTVKRMAFMQKQRIENMKDRHASLGEALTMIAGREANKLLAQAQTNADSIMSVRDIISLMQAGTSLERLARELATDKVEVETKETVDISKLSIQDLKTLKELKKKTEPK